MGSRSRVMAGVLLAIVALAGCSGSDDEGIAGGTARSQDESGMSRGAGGGREVVSDAEYEAEVGTLEAQGTGTGGSPGSDVAPGLNLPEVGPAVIKTASLELEVDENGFRDAIREGISIAERNGGFVVTTSVEDERRGRGSLILRVPSERFGTALAAIEDLGDVKSETVSGQDVSQEFVDLEARLRNLTAQEAVLLRLMGRSRSIADTIRVQRELEDIQLEIERLRGRIRFLEDQTNMGTIEVAIEEVDVVPTRPSQLQRAWEQAVDVSMAIVSGTIVVVGFIVPIAILIGLALLVYWRLKPRVTA